MNFAEINFNKKNRRPVTETTYQIDADEWNALGSEVIRLGSQGGGSNIVIEAAWDTNEYSDVPE